MNKPFKKLPKRELTEAEMQEFLDSQGHFELTAHYEGKHEEKQTPKRIQGNLFAGAREVLSE